MEVRASHILVDTEAEAKNIKKMLDEGQSFDSLARKYSKCPSSEMGGDLGFFGKGMMVKPFEDAAFSLQVGQTSNPVKSEFGYHLIKLTGKK